MMNILKILSAILVTLSYGVYGRSAKCPEGKKTCVFAKECFNPSTQFCCGQQVMDKATNHRCCFRGPGIATVFDPKEYICCNGKLKRHPTPGELICCNKEIRKSSLGLCCDGVWHETVGTDDHECCGGYDYNIKKHLCCTKWTTNSTIFTLHPRRDNSECCGLHSYDVSTQTCHGDKVLSMYEQDCGDQTFDFRQKICCNGKLIDKTPSSYQCCGDKAQHKKNEICCVDPSTSVAQVFTKGPHRDCCGSSYMGSENGQICCNNKVFQIDSADGLTECCAGQLINKATNLCCNGMIQEIPKTNGNKFLCCGSEIFNRDTQHCLGEKILPNIYPTKQCGHEETDCICNGEEIHREGKLCCKWVAVTKSAVDDNRCCVHKSVPFTFSSSSKVSNPCWNPAQCNGQLYDDTKYICCGTNIIRRSFFGNFCCGDIAYHKQPGQTCKNGRITYLDNTCRRKVKTMCRPLEGQTIRDLHHTTVSVMGKYGRYRCENGKESLDIRRPKGIKSAVRVNREVRLRVKISKKCTVECLPAKQSKLLLQTKSRKLKARLNRPRSGDHVTHRLKRQDKLFMYNPSSKTFQTIRIKCP